MKNLLAYTARSLYGILSKVLPFLKHKKPVCEKLIEFYNTNRDSNGNLGKRKSYHEVIAKREFIVDQIHILNSKGVIHI